MLARHKQLLGSYERVQAFLVANPPPNPSPAYAAKREAIAASIARLNTLLSDQAAGQKESQDDTGRIRLACRNLRENHLAKISQLAKALLARDPAVRKALALPDWRLPTKRLIADAEGFLTSAARYSRQFIEAGRPENFLEQIDAAIEAVRAAVAEREASRRRHVGARAGLRQEFQAARRLLLELDVLVRESVRGNQQALAQWELAKRVQKVGTVPRATGGTSTQNVDPEVAA
jgi:hypothetical protein